jgi:thiol-disulfide isomerase/thioredoxin
MFRALALTLVFGLVGTGCGRPDQDGSQSGPLLPRDRLALPEYGPSQFQALLHELRGTPVVVNFWGSWCPPCRDEAPDLAAVARQHRGEVQFLGVDFKDNRGAARDFIREFDWPYPSIFDPDDEIRPTLGYVGQPVTVIYSRAGEIGFEWVGAISAELLRKEIDKVL